MIGQFFVEIVGYDHVAIYRLYVVHPVDVNHDSGWHGGDDAKRADGFRQQFWRKFSMNDVR